MEEIRSDMALEAVDAAKESEPQQDSFTTLDYTRELFLNSEEQKKLEKKKLRLVRAAVAMVGIMTAVVILSAALVVPALLHTANEANETLTVIQKIDVETIAADVDALSIQANKTFVEVGEAVTVLNGLDMVTLNATITQLKTAVDSFSELDVAKLNEAITNLNATVAPLARFFGVK